MSTHRHIETVTRPLVDALSAAMEARRVSREEVATACGVSPQHVSNWKKGVRQPDLAQLGDWAEALHLDLVVTLRDPGDLGALTRPETDQRLLGFIVELVTSIDVLNPRRLEALRSMIDTWKRLE